MQLRNIKLLAGNVHTVQSSPFTRLLNRFFSYFPFLFLFLLLWQERFSLEIWDDGWVNRAATCLVRFVSPIAIQTSGYTRRLYQRLCGVIAFSFLIFLCIYIFVSIALLFWQGKKKKERKRLRLDCKKKKKKGWSLMEYHMFETREILFYKFCSIILVIITSNNEKKNFFAYFTKYFLYIIILYIYMVY